MRRRAFITFAVATTITIALGAFLVSQLWLRCAPVPQFVETLMAGWRGGNGCGAPHSWKSGGALAWLQWMQAATNPPADESGKKIDPRKLAFWDFV